MFPLLDVLLSNAFCPIAIFVELAKPLGNALCPIAILSLLPPVKLTPEPEPITTLEREFSSVLSPVF